MTLNQFSEDKFTKSLSFAFAIHIGIFILLIGYSQLFRESQKTRLTIIESSVRVDVVGMPKFTVQELKKMQVQEASFQKESTETQAPKSADKEALLKKSKKVDINKLLGALSTKQIAKKRKIKREKNLKAKKLNNKKLRSIVLEGNQVSKGARLVGDFSDKELNSKFVNYAESLPIMIKPYWRLPSYLIEAGYKCRVRVYINADGELVNTKILESSGNKEYDQKALNALKKAAPFSRPDVAITSRLIAGELVLGFPL